MTDATPLVSIIVNTLDRASHLRQLLASLGHLDYPAFEVVVVNGPSTDDTEDVLAEFASRIVATTCPVANLGQSRNVGLLRAAGDLVAFIDDDALPAAPGWLGRLVAPLVADARCAGAGGPVLVGDSSVLEFDGGTITDYGEQVYVRSDRAPAPDGRAVERVIGCNCAFRREAVLGAGGFDETFTWVYDESDLCVRLARSGLRIVRAPDAVVRHYRAPARVRRSFHDLAFGVIARSDVYFALKNGGDPLPRRLWTALRLAPRKPPFTQIRQWAHDGHFGPDTRLRYLARSLAGAASGLWLGLARPRRLLTMRAAPAPAPTRFVAPRPARRLVVALLSRLYPPGRDSGGIGRYTHELAHGLHALGHEVHVFTEADVALRREGIRLLVHGVRPRTTAVVQALPSVDRQLRWSVAVAEHVAALERRGTKLDVLESPSWEVEGLALRRRGNVPVVVRLHSPMATVAASQEWAPTPDLAAAVALERWLLAHAARVTSSTLGVARTVAVEYGLDLAIDPRYARIPLGIPPGVPPPPDAPGPARLLFVGRLEPRKGAHTLLAALPSLLARHSDLHVDVVGDDTRPGPEGAPHRARFEAAHRDAPWLARCHFHGIVDDHALARFYRTATLLVAPSLYESFGLIYVEAMRWGKPVVGCPVGGVPEVVRDGETGLLVPPGDPDALADAVERLLGDRALRARLGAGGRRAVETEFSSALMAQRTADLYAALVTGA